MDDEPHGSSGALWPMGLERGDAFHCTGIDVRRRVVCWVVGDFAWIMRLHGADRRPAHLQLLETLADGGESSGEVVSVVRRRHTFLNARASGEVSTRVLAWRRRRLRNPDGAEV